MPIVLLFLGQEPLVPESLVKRHGKEESTACTTILNFIMFLFYIDRSLSRLFSQQNIMCESPGIINDGFLSCPHSFVPPTNKHGILGPNPSQAPPGVLDTQGCQHSC